uniref:Uncharacterized protein n=1 Tax=Rhizophora mucronata TaxID=61149 RepID=A0A2P2NGF1_RHIMU
MAVFSLFLIFCNIFLLESSCNNIHSDYLRDEERRAWCNSKAYFIVTSRLRTFDSSLVLTL